MTLLLIYLTIAIGISFMCSVLEAVLLSITPSYVEQVSATSPSSGKLLARIKNQLDESLSSILILNTFAHTMGAAGVGSQAAHVFGAQWETLIAVLLTLIILYFSEIIPKTLGATFWRRLAVPTAFIIVWLVRLVFPLVWLATRLTRLFSSNDTNEITREEIIALASLSHKDGTLFAHENEYVNNILNLREIKTEQVLTPRSVVHMLDKNTTISEALDNPQTKHFSRMPIYGNNIDDIVGKVIKRDLFEAERNGLGGKPVGEVAEPITRVSGKLPVQKLLDMFIESRAHLFLVEDEFGQTSGIVTLEDAIETFLGREILDDNDTVADMQEFARSRYRERKRTEKRN